MVYTLRFFSSKCSLFHNSNIFGSCVIHILYTGCAKIKKNNSGAKRLIYHAFVKLFLLCVAGNGKTGPKFFFFPCGGVLKDNVPYRRIILKSGPCHD